MNYFRLFIANTQYNLLYRKPMTIYKHINCLHLFLESLRQINIVIEQFGNLLFLQLINISNSVLNFQTVILFKMVK